MIDKLILLCEFMFYAAGLFFILLLLITKFKLFLMIAIGAMIIVGFIAFMERMSKISYSDDGSDYY